MTADRVQIDTMADPILVTRQEFRGNEQIGIRFYYRHAGTGELLPGKQGINIPVQFAPSVLKALQEVLGVSVPKKVTKNRKR